MSWAAHDQQVNGFDQLRRSVSHGHAFHIGVWTCFPSALAYRLGDFMGVAEHALVHDGDLHLSTSNATLDQSVAACLGALVPNGARRLTSRRGGCHGVSVPGSRNVPAPGGNRSAAPAMAAAAAVAATLTALLIGINQQHRIYLWK